MAVKILICQLDFFIVNTSSGSTVFCFGSDVIFLTVKFSHENSVFVTLVLVFGCSLFYCFLTLVIFVFFYSLSFN